MKQAVILAGGKGTRLRERLGDLPKPLVDVAGVPLLERQINSLRQYGYKNLIVLVNYQAQYIEQFCKQAKFQDLNISIIDDGEPLGTAGATLKILDQLEDQVLVVYGDTMFDIDLNRFELFHNQDPNIAATLFLHPNDHPADSDLVQLDQSGYISQFHPYPHPKDALLPNLVNAALYLLNTKNFKKFIDFPSPSDFAKNLFPHMLSTGELILGYSSPEYIKDAGTPERLDKVTNAVQSGLVERSNLCHSQKAVFIDRDGTLNEEIGSYITSPELLHIYPLIGESLKKLNNSEWRAILVTNQPILARGDCTFEELGRINAKLESEVAKSKAFFDRIYICPHHPDKGFAGEISELKIKCSCRKPNPGLFLQAQKELNIDLSNSWHIGDTTADLGAAINAGVSSITVETGHGGLDDKFSYQPEFSAPSFSDAVEFILNTYPSLSLKIKKTIEEVAQSKTWFIGGLSRSGKSTIANIIKRELKIKGIDCHVISLDRWLLSAEKRGDMVYERYDIPEIINTIKKVQTLDHKEVIELSLPNYSKKNKQSLNSTQTVIIKNEDILIWEGVVANFIAHQLDHQKYSIYVETQENERRLRVIREYQRRGLSEAEIENLLAQRDVNEHAWVRSQRDLSAKIISL
jgi:histidinol-phosphate phosphatase family protein